MNLELSVWTTLKIDYFHPDNLTKKIRASQRFLLLYILFTSHQNGWSLNKSSSKLLWESVSSRNENLFSEISVKYCSVYKTKIELTVSSFRIDGPTKSVQQGGMFSIIGLFFFKYIDTKSSKGRICNARISNYGSL
mgnify:CR=1 FL=1